MLEVVRELLENERDPRAENAHDERPKRHVGKLVRVDASLGGTLAGEDEAHNESNHHHHAEAVNGEIPNFEKYGIHPRARAVYLPPIQRSVESQSSRNG